MSQEEFGIGSNRSSSFSTVTVDFCGLRSRTGPLSWSQRWSWDIVQDLVPQEQRIDFVLTLPTASITVNDVVAVLTDLLNQYETLRTTYEVRPDGEPWQTVRGSGSVGLEVAFAEGLVVDDVIAGLRSSLANRRFDLAHEIPLRVGVVVEADGQVISVTVVLSNMTLDGWSLELFRRELSERLRREESVTVGHNTDWPQPLDQVEFELGPRGRRVASDGLQYWREQMDLIASLPAPTRHSDGEDPRYWHAEFSSTALARAGHTIAARWRVPSSAVLLAGLATLVGQRLGQPMLPCFLVSSNRHQLTSRCAMTKYMQSSPMVIDVTENSFEQLVRTTSARMVRASRFGQVDPLQVAALVNGPGPHQGAHVALPVVYDFHHQDSRTAMTGEVDASDVRRAAVGSRLTWSDAIKDEKLRLYFQVNAFDQNARLGMWVDTRYLSRIDVAVIAFGTERLLIEAVAGTTDVAKILRAVGVVASDEI